MPAYLHGLATALPPNCLTQAEVRERASIIFGETYPQFDRLSKTFDTAGIDTRYSVVPIDWFSHDHGWADRNAAFMAGAKALFIEAAQRALEDAGWAGSDVDCVVTVTSTGIATPSLEAQAFGEMGFREDIMRVPVFGLGCAGGVSGLSTAQAIAAGRVGPARRCCLLLKPVLYRFAQIGCKKPISSQLYCSGMGLPQLV